MITAIDTNVLLDVFGADPRFGSHSQQALRSCMMQGSLVACDVVWAEVAGFFLDPAVLTGAMNSLGIAFRAVSVEAALDAGRRWRGYRQRGGKRDRVVADFLVGAHALRDAERLLTRDRGFYRTYFRDLHLLDPSEGRPHQIRPRLRYRGRNACIHAGAKRSCELHEGSKTRKH